ncbi:MAG TPA: ABC transporter permease [Vicinamibacterales bacterium]|nr:ABC transporter permease [Vicinamibacterales bacterium]
MIDSLWNLAHDIRYSLRTLRKTPAFTTGAILTVALTVGATTAIFSVVYGVLLRQLPYRQVEQVFWMWSDQPGRDRSPFNVPDFIDYRDSTRTLSGLGGYFAYSANLSDEAAAELVPGIRATGNLFDVIGAQARIGRLLLPGDERPGAEPVVVLAEPFWRRRFGGDSSIVGRSIRLNSDQYTVVGVIAAGFATPIRDLDFVLPFAPDQDARRGLRNSLNFIQGVGRLRDQVSQARATSELNAIARRLREQFPVENARKRGVRLVALIDGIAGPFRTALLTLFAAVGAVLLIACANLANLMLTRAASRRKDLAVRLALGSSRAKVVRQVLIEASLLGIAGGLLGVLIARWGVIALVALAPTALPRSGEIRLDLAVLTFSLVISIFTGVLFGVVPAFTSARVDVREALQGSNRGTTSGGQRIRGALVSSEVALAVALLIVMTLLAKSFVKVQAVAPGFDSTRVLSARVRLPAKRFNNREAIVTFQRALAEQLSTYPTVRDTGAITPLPLSGLIWRVPFTVEGRFVEREQVPLAQFRTVSPGFFEAARIPLRRGRTFSERDSDRTRSVAVVNEELANRWLTGLEPVGARLLINDNEQGPRPVEVIGVVGNVQQISLDGDATLDLYLPYPQIDRDSVEVAAANMFWIVRTTGDPMNVAPSLAREVTRLDSEVAVSQMRPLDNYVSGAMASRRFSLSLMAIFALAALLLAITGIYAVVMYSASQRAHEIGIRVALGASRANIVRLVIRHGLMCVLVGLAVGLVVAVGATRLMSTLLFGLAATDAVTFLQVSFVVAAASVVACALPTLQIRSANLRSFLGESR